MDKVVKWPLWSAEQIVDALPGLVAVVEIHLQDLPPEHLEKNRTAVEILKGDVPGTAQIPVYVIGTGDGDFHEGVKTLQS